MCRNARSSVPQYQRLKRWSNFHAMRYSISCSSGSHTSFNSVNEFRPELPVFLELIGPDSWQTVGTVTARLHYSAPSTLCYYFIQFCSDLGKIWYRKWLQKSVQWLSASRKSTVWHPYFIYAHKLSCVRPNVARLLSDIPYKRFARSLMLQSVREFRQNGVCRRNCNYRLCVQGHRVTYLNWRTPWWISVRRQEVRHLQSYNRDAVCLLRGTSWIFVYNLV